MFRLTVWQSPMGALTLAARGDQLVAVRFGDEREQAERFLHRQEPAAVIVEHRDPAGAVTALHDYFAGDLGAVDRLQVEFYGTEFQRRVWTALRTVSAGRTASYSDIANAIGAPTATRAVAVSPARGAVRNSVIPPASAALPAMNSTVETVPASYPSSRSA